MTSSSEVLVLSSIHFSKYHGIGNDFILIDNRHTSVPCVSSEQCTKFCDRNRGIGADGVLFALQGSNGCHYTMVLINADGREAEMCGNGIRCLAIFLMKLEGRGIEYPVEYDIWTKAGRITTKVTENGLICVNMGSPELFPWSSKAGIERAGDASHFSLELSSGVFNIVDVSMGNPHAVIFVDTINDIMPVFAEEGRMLNTHKVFPNGTNVEFVQVLSRSHLKVEVWERGVGRTLACGTGACAAVVAAVINDHVDRTCVVSLPGGDLSIEWCAESNKIFMTGPAVHGFNGVVEY